MLRKWPLEHFSGCFLYQTDLFFHNKEFGNLQIVREGRKLKILGKKKNRKFKIWTLEVFSIPNRIKKSRQTHWKAQNSPKTSKLDPNRPENFQKNPNWGRAGLIYLDKGVRRGRITVASVFVGHGFLEHSRAQPQM